MDIQDDEYTLIINIGQYGSADFELKDTTEARNTALVNEDIRAAVGREGDVD